MKKIILITTSIMTVGTLLNCSIHKHSTYFKSLFNNNNDVIIVTGKIYDSAINNRILQNAVIKDTDTNFLARTNADGKYRIELQPGNHIFRASYLGYKMVSTKVINLKKGDSLIVDFILQDANEILIN